MATSSAPQPSSLAGRFREMTSLWHLWHASVLEDLGHVPEGLEHAVATTLAETLQASKEKLAEASFACQEALDTLQATGPLGATSPPYPRTKHAGGQRSSSDSRDDAGP